MLFGPLLALALLAPGSLTFALDPGQRLRDLHHTKWAYSEGAPTDVYALAQTPDGFLWLGGASGLYRFDGVKFEPFEAATGMALPQRSVSALSVSRDGGLIVGYQFGGISIFRDGVLTHYGEGEGLPPRAVLALAEDADRTLWASLTSGRLMKLRGGRWEPLEPEAALPALSGPYRRTLFFDRYGTMWVLANPGTFYRLKGEPTFHSYASGMVNIWSLAEAPHGPLWMAREGHGAAPLVLDGDPRYAPRTQQLSEGRPRMIRFDRDGALWSFDAETGLQRVRHPEQLPDADVERFSEQDGLSSDTVNALLEDREGNIWVATAAGLDRFRPSNFTRVVLPPGSRRIGMAPAEPDLMIAGSRFGNVVEIGSQMRTIDKIRGAIDCLYRDPAGEVWIGNQHGLFRRHGGDYLATEPAPPPNAGVQAIVRDRTGAMWLSLVPNGVFELSNGQWRKDGGMAGLPDEPALTMVSDAAGRLWLGYRNNHLALIDGEHVRLFSAAEGLRIGNVNTIAEKSGRVWVGGANGLMRYEERGAFWPMLPADPDAFNDLSGVVETSDGDLWLNGSAGVARVPHEEWARAEHDHRYQVRCERFDHNDGLQGPAEQLRPQPSLVEGLDGRLWFSAGAGLQWLDPRHLHRNGLAPPVMITSLRSGDHRYRPGGVPLALPVSTSQIALEYTATSLSIPERVTFRYRLDPVDEGWVEAGKRREASYTNLGPGHYTFRLQAANEQGVWNTEGTSLGFDIPPAFTQTRVFLALCGMLAAAALGGLYQFRLRRVAGQIQARLEERLSERERIARELHDTLLQGFQALVLHLEVAKQHVPVGARARQLIEQSLEHADEVLLAGRDRVNGLRSFGTAMSLSRELASIGARLASDHPARYRVRVTGAERELHPLVAEEAAGIGHEALVNAFRHARASEITLDIAYTMRELRLRVRDDGVGFDTKSVGHASSGHWGLVGIRERAARIKAQLEIRAEPGGGTEVHLRVPRRVAYGRSRRMAS